MPELVILPNAVTGAQLEGVRDAALSSPLIARSTLAGSFSASRGYAVTFTEPGRAEVEAKLPFLSPFLKEAIDGRPEQALRTWAQRLITSSPGSNAWYVNL